MLFPLIDENPTRRTPYVTVGLIVVNTLLLLAMFPLDNVSHLRLICQYGFVPQRLTSSLSGGESVNLDISQLLDSPEGREILGSADNGATDVLLPATIFASLATMFSSMFLHAGIGHLVGNMWFLWLFGNNIEDRLGHIPFTLFYLTGGIFAALAHWAAIGPDGAETPTVGASGAVAAVLGAYAVTYPRARVRCMVFVLLILFVDLPAVAVLGIWIVGQLLEGLTALHLGIDGGVAWWAHIGGFIFGMALMPLLAMIIPDTTYQSVLDRRRELVFRPGQERRPPWKFR